MLNVQKSLEFSKHLLISKHSVKTIVLVASNVCSKTTNTWTVQWIFGPMYNCIETQYLMLYTLSHVVTKNPIHPLLFETTSVCVFFLFVSHTSISIREMLGLNVCNVFLMRQNFRSTNKRSVPLPPFRTLCMRENRCCC